MHQKRHRLEPYVGTRMRFMGTVGRFSESAAYSDKTIMLKDIRVVDDENDQTVADHVWFRKVAWADGLKEGQIIQFNADVMRYKKRGKFKNSRKPRVKDIKLDNAGNISVV